MAAMNNAVVKTSLIAASVLAMIGITVWLLAMQKPQVPEALQGMGGDFQLESADGPVSLHDFRGKVTLVYFGYTHCPDVCPMALGVIGAVIKGLSGESDDRVAGIFISLDPRRDTPALLGGYTAFFDPLIHGVTGSPEQLAAIADAWRVGYSVPDEPAGANYAVEHSTFIYLVNPEGKIANLFDEQTAPEEIATAVRRWLR